MLHKNGTDKRQAILIGDGLLSLKNWEDFMKEVTFEMGFWRLMDLWSSKECKQRH